VGDNTSITHQKFFAGPLEAQISPKYLADRRGQAARLALPQLPRILIEAASKLSVQPLMVSLGVNIGYAVPNLAIQSPCPLTHRNETGVLTRAAANTG
jgi:hypothetical protein